MENFLESDRSSAQGPSSEFSQTVAVEPARAPASSLYGSSRGSSVPPRPHRRRLVAFLMFAVVALALLLIGIGKPAKMYFDEGFYVPEARAFLQDTPNPHPFAPPLAKPPLGKLLMALGMKIAGDDPFGWRIANAVCGFLTLPAVYFWAYLLLRDHGLASLAAALALFNNFLFVMSRVAMMDAFLMVFLLWSLVAYTAAVTLEVRLNTRRFLLACSGVLVGLAGACKWNAIDTLAVFCLVSVALLWVARRASANSDPSLSRYAHNVKQIGVPALLAGLIVAPIASYSLAFWPLCRILHRPFSVHELVAMNIFIWHFNSTAISNPFLISPWYSWPLRVRPQAGILPLIGNPVITWGGLVALALCLRRAWKSLTLPEALVLLLYASNFLQWAVTPEKGLFYYYYYPSVMVLSVAIPVALRGLPPRILGLRMSLLVLVFAVAVFVWCYPQMAHLETPWDCIFGCWW